VHPSIPVTASFLISLFGGHVFVYWGMRPLLRTKGKVNRNPASVGYVERFTYTGSIIACLPIEIIGGWLVLKGIAQFKPRGDAKASTEEILNQYYGYLVGTGRSLIVGVASGLLGRHWLGAELMPRK